MCVTHLGTEAGVTAAENVPGLTGRVARCSQCGKEKPSSFELPFFELASGPRTWSAEDRKDVEAAMEEMRHEINPARREELRQVYLKLREAAESRKDIAGTYDLFYCGCRGWD